MNQLQNKRGVCFWITGLAGAGKTTLAQALVAHLRNRGISVILVDGDLVREILGQTNEFDRESRTRIGGQISRLCKNLTDQGVHVICATISLFKEIQEWNRANIQNFHEIYVDVPIEELTSRDKKQIYSGAKAGVVKNVVGIDLPFDLSPCIDLRLINVAGKLEENKRILIEYADKVIF